jgi:hypothetical protein
LKQAESYLYYAELALDDKEYDPAAGNAVIAAIAAADALCCMKLGKRSADDDHQAALALVAKVDKSAAEALGKALGVKHRAHYDHLTATGSAAKATVRAASKLVTVARTALSP